MNELPAIEIVYDALNALYHNPDHGYGYCHVDFRGNSKHAPPLLLLPRRFNFRRLSAILTMLFDFSIIRLFCA